MYQDHDALIRLRLSAEGMGDLYPMLRGLAGLMLGNRFVLRRPFAVGGQSILWVTEDLSESRKSVLTRLALLPYHRPAYIKDVEIQRTRERIEREASLLERFKHTSLPRLHGLFYAPNPLHSPERGAEITNHEPYLVMELIEGANVAKLARTLHAEASWTKTWQLGVLALEIVWAFGELCHMLRQGGYLYTDLNPKNLVVPKSPSDWKIRVVDAGSIIPVAPRPDLVIPFSWAYLPPDYHEAYRAGQMQWPTEHFVLYTLGKTLWQVLTNRQPMPGEHPDLRDATFVTYPTRLVDLITALIRGDCRSFDELRLVAVELDV